MKRCSHCQTSNAETNRFCQQCGRPLEPAVGEAPIEPTVRWTGQAVGGRVLRRAVSLAALFGTRERLVIGRAPDCDVCLPHPTVSRYHARLERRPAGLFLHDLGSVNGVLVGGRRITEPTALHEDERVGIGPFLFTLHHGVIQSLDSSRSLRLEAHHVEKVVSLPGGQTRKLLDDVSLVVQPGEFVTLLGPSGSGKSTLMDCLNGRRRATGGQVLANGEDFYRHFDNFRQSLGYVPQKDIVHTQLTVRRALYYTARLRLPTDTSPAELEKRIDEVLREMELGPHRDTLVANLSGGQIKRVSLGAELLAQPSMLYIDEATSGLDAGTEARMMRLFRGLADEGRSLVCITHNVDNVEQCHLVLVLARGRVVYFGPPHEAPRYFGVRRISDIYDRLAHKDVGEWVQEYNASPLCQEFIRDRLAPPPFVEPIAPTPAPVRVEGTSVEVPQPPPSLAGSRPSWRPEWPLRADRFRQLTARALRIREWILPVRDQWRQFRVLMARYVELILSDRRGLRLLLLQAPIVAVFLLVGFVHKDFRGYLPLPRPLEPEERRLLTALAGLDRLLDTEGPLDPSQQAALRRVHFQVEVRGLPATLDGTQVVGLLRQLWQRPLTPTEERLLEEARFTFTADGQPTTVNGADLVRVMRKLRKAQIPAKLLAFQGPVVPDREGINPRYTYMLLFILVMIVLWFGCNNAAKEIVKEEAIYGRERAVNLAILPYLASKFLVLSVMTVLNALLLMAILYGTLELLAHLVPGHTVPSPTHMLGYLPQFGVLVLLSMTGVALGLLLSACVATPDRANTLLPYVLIPQIILGGGLIAVQHGLIHFLAATLSPVYWAYRAIHLGAHDVPVGFPGHVHYADDAAVPCAALVAQMIVLLLLTAWFLRRKEA